MQLFSHWRTSAASLTGGRDEERERGLLVQRDPSEGISHPRWVYRDPSVLQNATQLPVPTVEHLSTGPGAVPLRPRGSLKAGTRLLQKQSHYQVDLESCHHKLKVTIVCEREWLLKDLKIKGQMIWKCQKNRALRRFFLLHHCKIHDFKMKGAECLWVLGCWDDRKQIFLYFLQKKKAT